MNRKTRLTLATALTCLAIGVTACGPAGNKGGRELKMTIGEKPAGEAAITAQIATFDPNADVQLDLDKWGSQHPDEYGIQQAFYGSFGQMDQCVLEYKERKSIPTDKQLSGDAKVGVLVNPAEHRPLGVNANLPGKHDKDQLLKDCIREAAASAPYPTYDGPPRVIDFEFQLDAGSVWEDE
jgi:hypothetical protein